MGQESVFNLSGETYRDKFETKMSNLAKDWYLHKHFRLGKTIDNLELLHYQMFDFLCWENCELQKYINDKIVGNLEKKKKYIKLHIPIENFELVYNITNINNNITNITNPEYSWSEVNW